MNWPFIRKTRIAQAIAEAIKKEKLKGRAETEKQKAELQERLDFNHEMQLKEKDAEIQTLESEISYIENRTKGVERVYNKNSATARNQRQIISAFSTGTERFVAVVMDEVGKIYELKQKADDQVKKMEKKANSDLKALGNAIKSLPNTEGFSK